jgi:competence protein ComEC
MHLHYSDGCSRLCHDLDQIESVTPPIPSRGGATGRIVVSREMRGRGDRAADSATRLALPASGRAVDGAQAGDGLRTGRVRIALPVAQDSPGLHLAHAPAGAAAAPPPPMVPGAVNFARTAWFAGLMATGRVLARSR